MEIILLEKIKDLGDIGDLISVKGGFARNFLIPRKKALRATKENKIYFEQKRAEYEKENNKRKQAAIELADKVSGLSIKLIMQAGDDGRLYGSVMPRDISQILNQDHGTPIEKDQIMLAEKIKEIGIYNITLNFHPEVTSVIKLNIARSKEEAEIAMAALESKSEEDKTKSQESDKEISVKEEAQTEDKELK